jgi:hypothetical protein
MIVYHSRVTAWRFVVLPYIILYRGRNNDDAGDYSTIKKKYEQENFYTAIFRKLIAVLLYAQFWVSKHDLLNYHKRRLEEQRFICPEYIQELLHIYSRDLNPPQVLFTTSVLKFVVCLSIENVIGCISNQITYLKSPEQLINRTSISFNPNV